MYIGPHERFWNMYYSSRPETVIQKELWRYCCSCPGNVNDPKPAIGKFKRWRKRKDGNYPNCRKARWLYWRCK